MTLLPAQGNERQTSKGESRAYGRLVQFDS